jgi:S1-C subfamily serine protease
MSRRRSLAILVFALVFARLARDRSEIPATSGSRVPASSSQRPSRWRPTRSAHVRPWLGYLLIATAALSASYVFGIRPQQLPGDLVHFGRDSSPRLFASNKQYSVVGLYRKAVTATVYVDASSRPQSATPIAETTGTGFAIDARGDIVTNAHVIVGASDIWVETTTGKRLHATIVGVDPSSDLAVLRTSVRLPFLTLATDQPTVGDQVLAIGNPLGERFSASSGIVSGLGRSLTAPDDYSISNVVQTDALIDHGSSGGPLLNAEGRVIGVTSALAAENSRIGYAIPAATVRSVTDTLIAQSSVRHAWLGVSLMPLSAEFVHAFKLPVSRGILVMQVEPGSPAAAAGLRPSSRTVKVGKLRLLGGGDVIVGAAGKPVRQPADLASLVNARAPGTLLNLTVERSGELVHLRVRLGLRPALLK